MEDQVASLLAQTQSPEGSVRTNAEQQLQDLYSVEAFPIGLASIASHASVDLAIRQAALLSLKNYVLKAWSPELDDFAGQVYLSNENKAAIRQSLLDLATSESTERKIQSAASYVVSKIAVVDFPDEWPDLLKTLLQLIPVSSDVRIHGALKVLADLVEEGFEEQQLFGIAEELVGVLHNVINNDARKPVLRALAVSVLSPLLDSLELLLQDHAGTVKQFASMTMTGFVPIFLAIMKEKISQDAINNASPDEGSNDPVRGMIALKIQIVRVLVKLRLLFPSLMAQETLGLFTAVWVELSSLKEIYSATYIASDKEGRLEDTDGLPYTLDFLVLEDWDFLQACLRARPVRQELEKQLTEQGHWLVDIIGLAVSYARITEEEEGMWDIDVNVFLAEETAVTTNYTARQACSDFIIKIGEWIKIPLIDAFMNYMRNLFASNEHWKVKEAALYILNQVVSDWADMDNQLDSNITSAFLEFARNAQQQSEPFLRARGYLTSGSLLKITRGSVEANIPDMVQSAFDCITKDESEIVQVSCIRALQYYIQALPASQSQPLQGPIIQALEAWMAAQDLRELHESDDLLITLVETLRDVIMLDTSICIHGSGLKLLFSIASSTAANFQMIELATETFEEICKQILSMGGDMYASLCEKVLPSLIGAFDVGDLTQENALMSLAAEMLSLLAKFGPTPLPSGFVPTVMPRLYRLLLESTEEELLRACTTTVKYIIGHNAEEVWSWHDGSGKNGLEAVLVIVDRLLGPSVEDAAAAEVGGLASEIVEKAGSERLGPYLMQLLQAVAQRVSTAEQTHLVQSLISVFARLSLATPADVVDFLTQVQIGQENGLQVVMSKWLESVEIFSGYEEIRQNTMALAKLYSLHDPRLEQVMVKGDLIVKQSDRIMTRSKARQNPDQYTVVPVPVKIIKLLTEELAVGGAANDLATAGTAEAVEANDDDDDDDEDWEDEPGAFDQFANLGVSKAELLAFAEETPLQSRQRDDETQRFLGEFFRGVAQEPGFVEIFNSLTEPEQNKLRSLN